MPKSAEGRETASWPGVRSRTSARWSVMTVVSSLVQLSLGSALRFKKEKKIPALNFSKGFKGPTRGVGIY